MVIVYGWQTRLSDMLIDVVEDEVYIPSILLLLPLISGRIRDSLVAASIARGWIIIASVSSISQ